MGVLTHPVYGDAVHRGSGLVTGSRSRHVLARSSLRAFLGWFTGAPSRVHGDAVHRGSGLVTGSRSRHVLARSSLRAFLGWFTGAPRGFMAMPCIAARGW
nr:hypothetical protein GCM10020093_052710 [Planobispora longispora]